MDRILISLKKENGPRASFAPALGLNTIANVYINNLSHMTKMATMPIYGKNPLNIFFSETNRLILMKLGVKHPWTEY